jgi:hypothetical protein
MSWTYALGAHLRQETSDKSNISATKRRDDSRFLHDFAAIPEPFRLRAAKGRRKMVSRRIVVLGGLATVASVSGFFRLPFATRALTGNAMAVLEADAWVPQA